MLKRQGIGWIFFLSMMMIPGLILGSDPNTVKVGRFSAMTPGGMVSGWKPMTFRKIPSHTRYTLVDDHGRTVLRADSRASASGLVKKLSLNPADHPVLTWSWKVSNILKKGDVNKKSGDDYAARIYITFAENPDHLSFFQRTKMAAVNLLVGETLPTAALAYVWGNRAAVGSIHPNPYTDRLRMIVVESGTSHLNQWRSARRNILEDYRLAFGSAPPLISGVAVMTDTDNTGEAVTAWYGDIAFQRLP